MRHKEIKNSPYILYDNLANKTSKLTDLLNKGIYVMMFTRQLFF